MNSIIKKNVFSCKSLLKCFLILSLVINPFPNFACSGDYCGQPIFQDLANEGYERDIPDKFKFKDPSTFDTTNAFGHPEPGSGFKGLTLSIPPASEVPIILGQNISSATARPGDVAYAYVDMNQFNIPRGTMVELTILMAETGTKPFSRPGKLQIGANRLILPNKSSVWLKGLVLDRMKDSEFRSYGTGGRIVRTIGRVAIGTGVGAVAGLSAGAIFDKDKGTSTIVGTVIGAVVGGVWAAVSSGKDVVIPAGLPVSLSVAEGAIGYY